MIVGNDTTINLVGNSFNIPLVVPAMEKLNISVTFPGNKQDLLRWVKPYSIDPLSGTLALFNPINCGIFDIIIIIKFIICLTLEVAYITSISDFKIYETNWKYVTSADNTVFLPPV